MKSRNSFCSPTLSWKVRAARVCACRDSNSRLFSGYVQLPGEVGEGGGHSPGHALEEISPILAVLDFKHLKEGIANPRKRSFLA